MKKAKRKFGLDRKKALLGYLFTLPWALGFLAFTLFPLLFSLFMSTQKVKITADGIKTAPVGIGNFSYAITLDFTFIQSTLDTMRFVTVLTPLIVILALILAMLLNQKMKFRGVFRGIYFLPVVILNGILLSTMEDNGAFDIFDLSENGVLRWLEYSDFGEVYAIIKLLLSNIFTVLWFSGVQILVYLSGLQKLSREIYEAAYIDGANSWQTFWKLTFPSMKQFTSLNIVYTIVLLSTFPTSPVMKHIKTQMFGQAVQGLGYASAISWIYFIFILVLLFIFLALTGIDRKKGRAQ
jgi:ABC-type sugar transport system permease subunit